MGFEGFPCGAEEWPPRSESRIEELCAMGLAEWLGATSIPRLHEPPSSTGGQTSPRRIGPWSRSTMREIRSKVPPWGRSRRCTCVRRDAGRGGHERPGRIGTAASRAPNNAWAGESRVPELGRVGGQSWPLANQNKHSKQREPSGHIGQPRRVGPRARGDGSKDHDGHYTRHRTGVLLNAHWLDPSR